MPSFNKVIILGNVTREVELRYTPKGTAVCKVGLAVNRIWTNDAGEKKEETTFVEVDAFGRAAENLGKYLKKGNPVLIEGRLKLDVWDDKQTGEKRQKLGVVLESFQLLGYHRDKAAAPPATGEPAITPETAAAVAAGATEPQDDVPF